MKSEELLELLNGIGSDIVENAGSVTELYESSREGVSFRAEYSRKRTWKTVIVSIAATAAAVFGLFALVNIVKGGFFNYHGGPGDPDRSGYIYGSEEQTFTKDYDGLVLTVTTDKSEYKIGEPINLTASLENNTGKDIYLWQEGVENVNSVILMPCFSYLIEYPVRSDLISSGYPISTVNGLGVPFKIIPFKNGEKCVQELTFRTYTNYYIVDYTGIEVVLAPDYDKAAEPGVHTGELCIKTYPGADLPESYSLDDISTYTLDFSVTLLPADEDSENPGQTFTKDFGKLVLTITTDKTEYNIGEPINITATLENTTDEDIDLNNTLDAFVLYFDDLIEYPCMGSELELFPNAVSIKGKETLEQHCTFLTYTDYIKEISETGDIEYSPDLSKPAAPGVHIGHFGLKTQYSVTPAPVIADFSVKVNGETSESKNKAQTFTKDFDGLVLTVTTDKSTYDIGEPIELTATLENNRDEEVYLYYGMSLANYDVDLAPRFEDLVEYPYYIRTFDAVITVVPFSPGEKHVQEVTFQTYTDYVEIANEEGEILWTPDLNKPTAPGVHNGSLLVFTCPSKEYYSGITKLTPHELEFSVTVTSQNSETESSASESEPSEKVTGIYGETEIPDIPCGDKDYEGKANVIQESGALEQCLESMVFETHNFGDYTVKLIGDSVRTDKKNFPGSIYAQKLRIEIGKNGTKTEDMIYNDTLLYQSQFHTEYRLFADKIGSYLDIYKLECPVIAMRYFFDDDPARTVTKAVEFAVIQNDRLCGGFVGSSAAGTGVTMNPNMDWSDYRTILATNTSDGDRCRLSVFAADEFTVIDGKTLTDEEAGIRYTFDFSNPLPFELYTAEKIMS